MRDTRTFQKTIWDFYHAQGRAFPWRKTKNPYRIWVSEIMLQQTQTDRVVNFYTKFLRAFANIKALAGAPLREVIAHWQGLGYNRRALAMHRAAKMIESVYRGKFPKSQEELRTLPGIGPYTAAAIGAFAYNKPSTFIETNIRTVFIHHFFPRKKIVHDNDILPLVAKTVDRQNPREWYYALMDYGAYLKKTNPNPNRRSAHYAKQSKFEGSDRQIRGALIRELMARPHATAQNLVKKLAADPDRIERILVELQREGFVREHKGRYSIVS